MFASLGNPSPGEVNRISYTAAKKRKPKKGSCWHTPVSWDGAPIEYEEVEFKTIGKVQVVKPPALPRGYEIEFHDSWFSLYAQIYKKDNEYTFQQLDAIVSDIYKLEKLVGKQFGDAIFFIFEAYPGYCRWSGHFDDEWVHVESCIQSLLKQALPPHKEPHSAQPDGITNREYPPALRDVLQRMIDLLDSGEFVEPERD